MAMEVAGQPLFLTKEDVLPVMEKVAMYKLSPDPSKWDQEIMTFLHEQNPYLQDYDIRIHMNKTNPDSGSGVGQIVIEEKIAVPIIIESNKLYPLDLFWSEDKLQPMTKPSLMSALQRTNVGKAVEPGHGEISDVSIYQATRPPFSGKYSFAEGLTFTNDELQEVLSVMGSEALDFAIRTNPVFKDSLAAYSRNALTDEDLKKTASASILDANLVDLFSYSEIESPGIYSVVANGFMKRAAFVFDMVIDWDDQLVEGKKMALDIEDRGISIQDSMGGIPLELGGDFEKIAMAEDRPCSGDIGIFWLTKNGRAVATMPVKVLFSGSSDSDIPFVKVAELGLVERNRTVYRSPEYSSFTKVGENIFMSREWEWAKVGEVRKIAAVEIANKLDWPDDVVEIQNRRGFFMLEGLDVDGIPKEGAGRLEFEEHLSKVMNPETVSGLMKQAEDRGSVFFTVQEQEAVKTASEKRVIDLKAGLTKALIKMAHQRNIGPSRLVQHAAHVRPCERFEFLKFAVHVNEDMAKNTVDSILGLNFVNDENLYKFVEKTEILENALDTLAKLLLAARLGLDIEQAPLRTAMFSMDEVVRQLKSLGSQVYGEEE